MIFDIDSFLVHPTTSIRQLISVIDKNHKGIAIVAGEKRDLLGTVTDGDIRRALLADVDLASPASELLARKANSLYPQPIAAAVGTSKEELLQLMHKHTLRHIPLLDAVGRVTGLAVMEDLVSEPVPALTAVVMVGGQGSRLRPLTDDLPKPMLPVGDRPLLELIIERLHNAGIRRVNLTTRYKGELIAQHFGDGRNFGLEIRYVEEDHPLGTAGALGLLDASNEPLLVINGDILTRVDFRAMLEFHQEHRADMTVGVKQHELQVPYGVIETNGVQITGILEKPVVRYFINAGIYLLTPEVCRYIPRGQTYDMPDLISRLVAEGRRVISFPVREYWRDIGQVEDYQKALADVENGEV